MMFFISIMKRILIAYFSLNELIGIYGVSTKQLRRVLHLNRADSALSVCFSYTDHSENYGYPVYQQNK
jgi:hypothetical protein